MGSGLAFCPGAGLLRKTQDLTPSPLHNDKPFTARSYAVLNLASLTTATVTIGSTKPITITVTSSMPSSL